MGLSTNWINWTLRVLGFLQSLEKRRYRYSTICTFLTQGPWPSQGPCSTLFRVLVQGEWGLNSDTQLHQHSHQSTQAGPSGAGVHLAPPAPEALAGSLATPFGRPTLMALRAKVRNNRFTTPGASMFFWYLWLSAQSHPTALTDLEFFQIHNCVVFVAGMMVWTLLSPLWTQTW